MNSTRYQIVNRIARGGVGAVDLVRDHRRSGTLVVRKVALGEDRNQEVVSEARRLRSLCHPGLPWVYDCGIDCDGCFFYTM